MFFICIKLDIIFSHIMSSSLKQNILYFSTCAGAAGENIPLSSPDLDSEGSTQGKYKYQPCVLESQTLF